MTVTSPHSASTSNTGKPAAPKIRGARRPCLVGRGDGRLGHGASRPSISARAYPGQPRSDAPDVAAPSHRAAITVHSRGHHSSRTHHQPSRPLAATFAMILFDRRAAIPERPPSYIARRFSVMPMIRMSGQRRARPARPLITSRSSWSVSAQVLTDQRNRSALDGAGGLGSLTLESMASAPGRSCGCGSRRLPRRRSRRPSRSIYMGRPRGRRPRPFPYGGRCRGRS